MNDRTVLAAAWLQPLREGQRPGALYTGELPGLRGHHERKALLAEVQDLTGSPLHLCDEVKVPGDQSSGEQYGLRIEDVKDVGHTLRQVLRQQRVRGPGRGIAFQGEAADLEDLGRRIEPGDELSTQLPVFAQQRSGGHVRFKAAPPTAVAGLSPHANGLVSDGARKSVLPGQQLPVNDDAPADSGADADCDEIGQGLAGAEMQLCKNRGMRVIDDISRKLEVLLRKGAKVETRPSRKIVGGGENRSACRINGAGASNTQRGGRDAVFASRRQHRRDRL